MIQKVVLRNGWTSDLSMHPLTPLPPFLAPLQYAPRRIRRVSWRLKDTKTIRASTQVFVFNQVIFNAPDGATRDASGNKIVMTTTAPVHE